MRKKKLINRSQRTILLTLAVLAAFAFMLPSRWTNSLISLVQVFVPFQDAIAFSEGEPVPSTVPGNEHAALMKERDALQRRATAWAAKAHDLQQEVDVLTATRHWPGEEWQLGAAGSLIPARVITKDLLPWRSSRLVNTGSLQGVDRAAPVASASLDVAASKSLSNGLDVLVGEAFIGSVEQVGSHTSRIKLLSDPSVEMKVRLARHEESGLSIHDSYFWLVGLGDGAMRISDVDRRDVEQGKIAQGDLVLSDKERSQLPAPMIIGRVTEIQEDRRNPLLARLIIKSEVDPSRLERVYIFDPDGKATR